MTRLDPSSPERGWPPFMEWLEEHGIQPDQCRAIELGDGEDPRCVAELYALDEHGEKYALLSAAGEWEAAMHRPMRFAARRPAPRRTS